MANTILGKQILWGNTSVAGTITGSADLTLLQDHEFSRGSEMERIKDVNGNTASLVFFDHEDTLTWTFIPNNGTTAFATLAATSIMSPGTTLVVTDTYTQWASGTYAVKNFSCPRSNVKAMTWKLDLVKYPNTTCP